MPRLSLPKAAFASPSHLLNFCPSPMRPALCAMRLALSIQNPKSKIQNP
ncbi:hypothetical protein D1AOALGA4SA_9563 [Olavius algarvensis Delta 1 endosymbiont]|nr:hypothetical protein D1AOALGA4SA_9563 [Olavius algarvensis Delta 1 endosymbiont]